MPLTLRPMTRDDFPILARWLATPHVRRWWKSSETPDYLESHYGPSLDRIDPARHFIVLAGDLPIGMLQSFLVDDYPAHAARIQHHQVVGIDLLIGEPDYIGRGLGPEMLRTFIRDILPLHYPTATGIVSDPAVENSASIRAFEKAGFTRGQIVQGEDGGMEQLMVIQLNV